MSIWEAAGYCSARDDGGYPCALLSGHQDDCDFMAYPRWYTEAMGE